MEQSCGNCRFFVMTVEENKAGECHRRPPSVLAGEWLTRPSFAAGGGTLVNQLSNIAGQFPPVTTDIWCGDWDERYVKTEAN